MNHKQLLVKERYIQLVARCFDLNDEQTLLEIHDLGKQCLSLDIPPEQLAEIHHDALQAYDKTKHLQLSDIVERSAVILVELMMAYGVAFRERQAFKEKMERANFNAFIEQTGDLVIFSNSEGKISFVNAAFKVATAYDSDDISDIYQIIAIDKYAIVNELLKNSAEEEHWQGKLSCISKDKTKILCDAYVFSIDTLVGKHRQIVWLLRDITAKEILDKRLKHAQRMQSVGTLATGIAHDFNNIMYIILGMSELLQHELLDESAQAKIEHIQQAVKRGTGLVDRIMAFGKADKAEIEKLEPNKIIDEAVSLLTKTSVYNDAIKATVNVDGFIYINSGQLLQIIVNLCVNALHALQDNTKTVHLTLSKTSELPSALNESELDMDKWVVLTVEDNGCGIPEGILENIFDPFFTTKPVDQGTGMGLAVVHGIVKTYNGHVLVTSELGVGTCFSVYLPILQSNN